MTVTVSATVEGASSKLTTTVCPTSTSSPLRVTVVKPERVAVTRYAPMRTGIRYRPLGSVTISNVLPEAS